MAKPIPADELLAIEQAVRAFPEGASAQQLLPLLPRPTPLRTLQYRLRHLVEHGRLEKQGAGRSARYLRPAVQQESGAVAAAPPEPGEFAISYSAAAAEIQRYVRQPLEARRPVGYDRGFLGGYQPNVSFYLSQAERDHLAAIGHPRIAEQAAGTYARQILARLLIDLAWNSSRLEGNTYSLLDTRRLIEFGQEAQGRAHREAQMILNHKDAIEFLVNAADEIGFNRYTILNLHALLANNLLADPAAAGRLRYIAFGIERSVFHPLEVPQLIEAAFEQVLATAAAIGDPFEQAFFVMVQLPYLQPFDDVNKRVSRLAANIPLIKRNLSPLSFTDIPQQAYTDAVLGVYELNRIDLLKDVFLWAYERSAARYAAMRQSLGEPDPFRLQYRSQLREIILQLVRSRVGRSEAATRIADWPAQSIAQEDRQRFNELVEDELTSLHEGNFARYQIRPSEFAAWKKEWDAR